MLLGMGDGIVAAAYWANILVVAVCVVYGIINWNRGGDGESGGGAR